jgi:tRNA threonylcarbamoyl adenosine modification protein YeaZ
MILAIDTATAACTAALFDGSGRCVGRRDERIGRGHAERLVPMLAELLDGRRAEQVLVGVGPGSFTGIRVGVAAAHGLAIGWGAELAGFSSLALLALAAPGKGSVAAAMRGGHGELFVQQFDRTPELVPTSDLLNLAPAAAAAAISAPTVVGSGAAELIAARGNGVAVEAEASASDALRLPLALRSLPARPLYARAPDARAREAA